MIDMIAALDRNAAISALAVLICVQLTHIFSGVISFGISFSGSAVFNINPSLFFVILSIYAVILFASFWILFLPIQDTLNSFLAVFSGILSQLNKNTIPFSLMKGATFLTATNLTSRMKSRSLFRMSMKIFGSWWKGLTARGASLVLSHSVIPHTGYQELSSQAVVIAAFRPVGLGYSIDYITKS